MWVPPGIESTFNFGTVNSDVVIITVQMCQKTECDMTICHKIPGLKKYIQISNEHAYWMSGLCKLKGGKIKQKKTSWIYIFAW